MNWLTPDRKSTRLNSSHLGISYAVFCLKKKSVEDVFEACEGRNGFHSASAQHAMRPHRRHERARVHHKNLIAQVKHFLVFFNNKPTPNVYIFPPHAPLPT